MKYYTSFFINRGQIHLRGRENGKRFSRKIKCKPYLFVPSNKPNSEYKSIHGKALERMDFDSVYDAREFKKKYKDVSGFEIYGLDKHEYAYINDVFPGEVEFNTSELNIGKIDIETDNSLDPKAADKEVTAITVIKNDLIITLGCKEYSAPDGVIYIKCKDEDHMLRTFLDVWTQLDLDVISGWNVRLYDIPYLYNRILRVLGEEAANKLSPWGIVRESELEINNKVNYVYELMGIATLDYLDLYKKFTYVTRESYKLDHIAYVELGKKKLDYSEFSSLPELYKHDYQKYIDYNIQDTVLISELDEKLNLIELAIAMAYSAKINFSDVYSPIATWDIIIHNELMDNKIAVSPQKQSKKMSFEGAYVKPPIIGKHDWVVSFDAEALYPSTIVQYNISPETYRGKLGKVYPISELLTGDLNSSNTPQQLIDNNLSYTANSCVWDKDFEGLFPRLIKRFRAVRKKFKGLMLDAKREYETNPSVSVKNDISKYDNLQMARKLLLNSLYGALGNAYFRWYDLAFAEAITLTGQLVIKWVEKDVNAYLNSEFKTENADYVIAMDTDSLYLNLGMLKPTGSITEVIDFVDEYSESHIVPKIDESLNSLYQYTHGHTPFLTMKREAIASTGIFVAKKRYMLNVYDNEGVRYAEPSLKIMGVEAVKSSTPEVCREKLKQAIKLLVNGTESDVIKFIDDFRKQFNELPVEDISFPRSCNGMDTYANSTTIFGSKTPIQVRGGLVYNHYLKQLGLDKKYEIINNGDKVKYCYLKLPNPVRQNVISYVNRLPEELNLQKYIDYNTQFEKAFLDPLSGILTAIGYKSEKTTDLSSFF